MSKQDDAGADVEGDDCPRGGGGVLRPEETGPSRIEDSGRGMDAHGGEGTDEPSPPRYDRAVIHSARQSFIRAAVAHSGVGSDGAPSGVLSDNSRTSCEEGRSEAPSIADSIFGDETSDDGDFDFSDSDNDSEYMSEASDAAK